MFNPFRPRPLADPPPLCRYPHVPLTKSEDELPSVQSSIGFGVEADQVPDLTRGLNYGPHLLRNRVSAKWPEKQEVPTHPSLTIEGLEEYTRVRKTHPHSGWVLTESHFLDALVAEALEHRRDLATMEKALEALRGPRALEVGDIVEGWDVSKEYYRGILTVHIPTAPMSIIEPAEVKDSLGRWVPIGGSRQVYKLGLHRSITGLGR